MPTLDIHRDVLEHCDVALDRVIACGRFRMVFIGTSQRTRKRVAVKVESKTTHCPQLLYEARVYQSLARGNDRKVPKVNWHGVAGDFNIMVMDVLGPSLQDVFVSRGRSFTRQEVTKFGIQMLSAIEHLHSKDFIHRHIKPDNVAFHPQSLDKLYLIDLGLAKKYKSKAQDHIACRTNKPFLGDAAFASLRTHMGLQQSRRDDLESLAYSILYLSIGFLPWMAMKEPKAVRDLKRASVIDAISPKQIAKFWRYAHGLSFEAAPNYRYLKSFLCKHGAKDSKDGFFQFTRLPLSEYNFVSDWTLRIVPKEECKMPLH